jgi:hypothetical protein
VTALIRPGSYVQEVFANSGRWVARCGLCPNAEGFYEQARGRFVNQVTDGVWKEVSTHFVCRICGTVNELIWPRYETMQAVERLLMMRPNPFTRNWVPGETLHDLMFENGAHGIFDTPDELTPGQTRFSVNDIGIQVDRLPVLEKPRVRKRIDA